MEANGSSALRTTVSKAVVPEKMGMSEEQIRCRERTAGIRVALERMSQFFRVPYPKFTGWTRQRVIFFGEPTTSISKLTVAYHDCSSHLVYQIWRQCV